jgi:hypothetical protein
LALSDTQRPAISFNIEFKFNFSAVFIKFFMMSSVFNGQAIGYYDRQKGICL